MLEINAPPAVAEITALHDAYECALVANDIQSLNAFFWDSSLIVRYGVNEHLYGSEALAAYRQGNTPVFTDRKLLRRSVVALGSDVASVMCEFSQNVFGQPKHSRQSQVWARLPEIGWKIISAHVSNALTAPPSASSWEAYIDQAAAAVGLPLDSAHRTGVIQNTQRAAQIVAPLLAVALPPEAEIAPVFVP